MQNTNLVNLIQSSRDAGMATIGIVGYLFWPCEAIRLIKKFKADGTLNGRAVSEFRKTTLTAIAITSLGFPAITYISSAHIIPLIVFIISPFLVRWAMCTSFYGFTLIATLGTKERATVMRCRIGIVWNIDYRIERDQNIVTYTTKNPKDSEGKSNIPEEGASTFVYYYPKGKKYKVLPCVQQPGELSWREKYSLTTAAQD